MAQTPNYDLFLADDDTMSFLDWRNAMNGQENSNMIKIDTALHAKADRSAAFELTLTPDGWVGQEQMIHVNGLTASDNAIIGMCQGATDAEMEAAEDAVLCVEGYGDGTLTIRARKSVPSIPIPVCVIVF